MVTSDKAFEMLVEDINSHKISIYNFKTVAKGYFNLIKSEFEKFKFEKKVDAYISIKIKENIDGNSN